MEAPWRKFRQASRGGGREGGKEEGREAGRPAGRLGAVGANSAQREESGSPAAGNMGERVIVERRWLLIKYLSAPQAPSLSEGCTVGRGTWKFD